jgi:Sec-independent protein translocase protein TatA
MLLSLSELILVVLIVLCIVGLAKLPKLSEAIGRKRARRLAGDEAIDITPEQQRVGGSEAAQPKPGTRQQPVDEAVVDDDRGEDDSRT